MSAPELGGLGGSTYNDSVKWFPNLKVVWSMKKFTTGV